MKTTIIGLLTSTALSVGCGADVGIEDVMFTSEPLSGSCASSAANATFWGKIRYTSPQTYSQSTCSKGVVVDVSHYLTTPPVVGGAGGTGGTGPAPPSIGGLSGSALPDEVGATRVKWADAVPVDQPTCEATWLAAYLFERQSVPGAWTALDIQSARGRWNGTDCETPLVDFGSAEMLTGQAYRIAASARPQPTSSAPTRRLTIATRTQ